MKAHIIPGWLPLLRKAIMVPVALAGCTLELFDIDDRNQSPAVDGSGDFAVRLSDLTARIVDRYYTTVHGDQPIGAISSRTLQIVYGSEIRTIRDEVLGYLKLKGIFCSITSTAFGSPKPQESFNAKG